MNDREAFSKLMGMYADCHEQHDTYRRMAERAILELRCRLIELDPTVPRDLYDGNAWVRVEAPDALPE